MAVDGRPYDEVELLRGETRLGVHQGLIQIEKDRPFLLRLQRRELVEDEGPPRAVAGVFLCLGLQDLVPLSPIGGVAYTGEFRENFDEASVAGEDGFVYGGDDRRGGGDVVPEGRPFSAAVPAVLDRFCRRFLDDS